MMLDSLAHSGSFISRPGSSGCAPPMTYILPSRTTAAAAPRAVRLRIIGERIRGRLPLLGTRHPDETAEHEDLAVVRHSSGVMGRLGHGRPFRPCLCVLDIHPDSADGHDLRHI